MYIVRVCDCVAVHARGLRVRCLMCSVCFLVTGIRILVTGVRYMWNSICFIRGKCLVFFSCMQKRSRNYV